MKKLLIVLLIDLILLFSYDWTGQKLNVHQEEVKADSQEIVKAEGLCFTYSEYIIIV